MLKDSFILLVCIQFLVSCGGNEESQSSSSPFTGDTPQPISTPATENESSTIVAPPNDSYSVSQMRSRILRSIDDATERTIGRVGTDPETIAAVREIYGEFREEVRLRPANTPEELRDYALQGLEKIMAQQMQKLDTLIPKMRSGTIDSSKPAKAAKNDGDCTPEFIKDLEITASAMLDAVSKILPKLLQNPTLDAKVAFGPALDSCDALVTKYGEDAVCRRPDNGEKVQMAELKTKCDDLRASAEKL